MIKTSDRILIIGGNSVVGSFLANYLNAHNYDIFTTTKRKTRYPNKKEIFLDLSSNNHLLSEQSFEVAIFCAGVTQASKCENFPNESKIINVDNTIKVIEKLLLHKTRVLFLSSNAVFNGTKQFYKYFDTVSPNTNYGKYKVMVENFFDDPNFSILRLTKVLSKKSPLIINWENEISSGGLNGIIAFKNHFISPVSLEQVGNAVQLLLMSKSKGIFQLGSNHEISLHDFALEYFSSDKTALDMIVGKYDSSIKGNKYNSLQTYLPW